MASAPSNFVPPFCPNADCDFHLDSKGWRYKKDGHHYRQCDRRFVQRYRCTHCGRSYSSQTFSTSYWLKRPDLLLPILHGLLSCSAFRQIARAQSVSPSTVELHAARLGRHMLLFHEELRPKRAPAEPLVFDGFESFAYSQYWPAHLNTVVGAISHFHYATTVAELRRKGARTAKQTLRRAVLEKEFGRPDPKEIEKSAAAALALVVPEHSALIVLRTDDHRAYPRALRRLKDRHFSQAITSSKQARNSQNPLWPVNLLHSLMRHNGANHKRETIAWSKRAQSMVWRDALHRVWRNYVKHFSERRKDESPAMRLGLLKSRLHWPVILASRLFVTRVQLLSPLDEYYWGRIPTRQIPNARVHRLRFAY